MGPKLSYMGLNLTYMGPKLTYMGLSEFYGTYRVQRRNLYIYSMLFSKLNIGLRLVLLLERLKTFLYKFSLHNTLHLE